MLTNDNWRPAAARGRGSSMLVAIATVLLVFAAGCHSSSSSSSSAGKVTSNEALIKSGPMTPQKAKLLGKKNVDFGPNCDPKTGKVKIPSVYSPPCVQPFRGNNGGATSEGVTDKEIKLVVYVGDPRKDPLLAGQIRAAGASLDTTSIKQTWQGYVDIYNQFFELYGRKISVEFYDGTGSGADTTAAKNDAIAIADKKPFAVLGAPLQSTIVFSDELSSRGVMCLGICALAVPQKVSTAHVPYLFTDGPSPEESAQLTAELIGKQAGPGPAQNAGDPTTKSKQRVYGIAHYDTTDGQYQGLFSELKKGLKKYGITPKADVSFFLDPSRLQENARTIITKMKDAGVTTVIYTGDPLTPASLTKEATAQNFFPEWIVGPSVLADTSIFGRTFDQRQWEHAFGISLVPGRARKELTGNWFLYNWFHGTPPPNNTYGVINPSVYLFARGVQLAGPKLTPQTFRDGLFRYPPSGGDPINPQQSWGKHGVWPFVDYYGSDDAAIIWWDPTATGEDEAANAGTGLYRYALGAKRYTIGHVPAKGQGGLFDTAKSVTIFQQLPSASALPDYPSPARGG